MSRDLEARRRRLEIELAELRGAISSETGWAPRASRWAMPIVAVAVGLLAGLVVKRSLPRLLRDDD